jgi:hypothetical protein
MRIRIFLQRLFLIFEGAKEIISIEAVKLSRKISTQISSRLGNEMERLYAVFEECHRLLFDKDFHSLYAILNAEGFQPTNGLDLEQYVPDTFAHRLIELGRQSWRLDARFDRLSAEIKTGLTCHKCVGMGSVMKGKHYERERTTG